MDLSITHVLGVVWVWKITRPEAGHRAVVAA
jgi:hypothetical protein